MEEIDREGTINAIDWLEEEATEDVKATQIKRLREENAKFRFETEKRKCTTLAEMYGLIIKAGHYDLIPWYGRRICSQALALVQLSYEIEYIDSETRNTLMNYLHHVMAEYTKIEDEENK